MSRKVLVRKGFTLVELLIAVVIVGLLVAVALPNFLNNTNKSRLTEATQALSAINNGQSEYRFKHPGQYFQVGVDAPSVPTDGSTTFVATVPPTPAPNSVEQQANFSQVLGVNLGTGTPGDRWNFTTMPRTVDLAIPTDAADGTGVAATDFTSSAYGIKGETLKLGVMTVSGRPKPITDDDNSK
jgi:type IV pilus assembly protein PilA